MDRPRAEHQRQVRRDERTNDRPHPADAHAAVGLVLAQQHHERELALADLLAGHERESIAGRPEHERERTVVHQRRDQRRGIGAHVHREEAALEDDLAAVEHAHPERDRPGVEAGDTRTAVAQTSSLATSYTVSVSKTLSLLSNIRRMQVLWTFIFGPPMASAPRTSFPS